MDCFHALTKFMGNPPNAAKPGLKGIFSIECSNGASAAEKSPGGRLPAIDQAVAKIGSALVPNHLFNERRPRICGMGGGLRPISIKDNLAERILGMGC